MKLHNHFDIFIEKDNEIKKVGHAENVVLNSFYAALNSYNLPDISYLYIGTGTTTPDVTNTALANKIDRRVAVTDIGDYNEDEKYFTRNEHVEYSVTELNGNFITEVGIGGYSTLYTRALIMDNNGNPISIEKKSTERLIIYATIYIYRETYPTGHEMLQGLGPMYALGSGARDQAIAISALTTSAGNGYSSTTNHIYNTHYLKGNGLCKYVAFGEWSDSAYNIAGSTGAIKSANVSGATSSSFMNTGEYKGYNFFGVSIVTSNLIYAPSHTGRPGHYGILRDVKLLSTPNITAVVGTGDGIKTTFPIKHFGAKNIKCLVNGVENTSVVTKSIGNYESVNIWDPQMLGLSGIYYNGGYETSGPSISLSEPIPYLEGSIKISNRHLRDNKLLCIYSHIVDNELFVEFIELDAPTEIPCVADFGTTVNVANPSGATAPTLLPDKSGLIFNYNNTIKIFKYDAITGIIGSLICDMPTAGPLFFTPDMLHAMTYTLYQRYYAAKYIYDPAITLYSVTRTAEAISLTKLNASPINLTPTRQWGEYSCTVWGGGDYNLVNNHFKVYVNHYATSYKIDWNAITVSLDTITDISNHAIGNYFVARKPTDTTLQIGRRGEGDIITWLNTITDDTLAGCDIRTLVDTEDHIHIGWLTTGLMSDGNTLRGIVLQVVDDIAYTAYDYSSAGIASCWFKYSIGPMDFIDYNKGVPKILYPANQYVEFSTPPAANATIGVQYDLDYLPKDENWTVSTSYTINNQRG